VLLIVKFIPECNSSDRSTVYWSTAPAFSMTVTVVIVAVVAFRPVRTTARASAERTDVLAAFNVPTRAW